MRKGIWKTVSVWVLVFVVSGLVVFTYGWREVFLIGTESPQSILDETITLNPGEKYSVGFYARLNGPPVLLYGYPPPYIRVEYSVVGNVRCQYKTPSGYVAKSVDLDDSHTIRLSPYVAGDSELVLENMGVSEAMIYKFTVVDEYYYMGSHPLLMAVGLVLILFGVTTLFPAFFGWLGKSEVYSQTSMLTETADKSGSSHPPFLFALGLISYVVMFVVVVLVDDSVALLLLNLQADVGIWFMLLISEAFVMVVSCVFGWGLIEHKKIPVGWKETSIIRLRLTPRQPWFWFCVGMAGVVLIFICMYLWL
jgi:hypothetical protein